MWEAGSTAFLERDDRVARLTLNRPQTLNAIDRVGFEEIPRLLQHASADSEVRALIITGQGRGFCSGADLNDVVSRRSKDSPLPRLPRPVGGEVDLLSGLQIPIIASVNGPAAGLGLGLALLSDFRIASERATFSDAHVAAGLAPTVAAWYLPRLIGLSKATEVVILGRVLSATEALDLGLVNYLVAHDDLAEAAFKLAVQIAALPALAVIAAKAAIQRGLDESLFSVRELGGVANTITRLLKG